MKTTSKVLVTTCCVCDRSIKPDDNEVFSVLGQGHRHKRCGPGTKTWKAKFGENEITKLLEKSKQPKTTAGKDPLDGMAKYLRFMAKGRDIQWSISYGGRTVTSDDRPKD